jgi:NAD(P)-dependent dehydrogenase (short-subunit alcohol dehydrogenase family)
MQELGGKVAVVTGGASGIGLAMAQRFAGEGMKVVLADVEEQALGKAVAEMSERGADVLGVPTDVSDADAVARLRDETLSKHGKVHLICNNAGVGGGGLLWETSLEDWQWVLGVNLWGVVHGIRTFVPVMIEQDEPAHVINTASIAGLISPPGIGIYNATKHAVVALSETLHLELMMRGAKVKVSVLCPAWVRTNIADADRNRPEALRPGAAEPSAEVQAVDQAMRQVIATGMPPSEVADKVLEAVRAEQLYILTHPALNKAVKAHYDGLLAGKTPGFEVIAHLAPQPGS